MNYSIGIKKIELLFYFVQATVLNQHCDGCLYDDIHNFPYHSTASNSCLKIIQKSKSHVRQD